MGRQMTRRNERGFTLVELMVTVAVLAIVAAIAAPSFRNLLLNSRLTAAANELSAALQGARMEALRTNARVVVCPSTDGSSCAGSDWSKFVLISGKTGASNPLRVVTLNNRGLTVSGSSNVTGTTPIWYQADGFVRVGTAATQTGTIRVCASALSGNNARDVQATMGRVAVSRTTCSSTLGN